MEGVKTCLLGGKDPFFFNGGEFIEGYHKRGESLKGMIIFCVKKIIFFYRSTKYLILMELFIFWTETCFERTNIRRNRHANTRHVCCQFWLGRFKYYKELILNNSNNYISDITQ
jgi:hypothetical protein